MYVNITPIKGIWFFFVTQNLWYWIRLFAFCFKHICCPFICEPFSPILPMKLQSQKRIHRLEKKTDFICYCFHFYGGTTTVYLLCSLTRKIKWFMNLQYSSRKHTRKKPIPSSNARMEHMLTLFPTEIVYELFVCICANVNNLKYIAMDRICNNEISIARSQKESDRLKNLDPILYV